MSLKPAPLRETQESYEQRYNCAVCLCARLQMVWGMCQHRLCVDCLYDEENVLRRTFNQCPVCQCCEAFPPVRPDIPEDNIAMMWCLGVRECPNQLSGCAMQMWEWEMEDHMRSCKWKQPTVQQDVTLPKIKRGFSEKRQSLKAQRRPATRSTSRCYSLRSSSK